MKRLVICMLCIVYGTFELMAADLTGCFPAFFIRTKEVSVSCDDASSLLVSVDEIDDKNKIDRYIALLQHSNVKLKEWGVCCLHFAMYEDASDELLDFLHTSEDVLANIFYYQTYKIQSIRNFIATKTSHKKIYEKIMDSHVTRAMEKAVKAIRAACQDLSLGAYGAPALWEARHEQLMQYKKIWIAIPSITAGSSTPFGVIIHTMYGKQFLQKKKHK